MGLSKVVSTMQGNIDSLVSPHPQGKGLVNCQSTKLIVLIIPNLVMTNHSAKAMSCDMIRPRILFSCMGAKQCCVRITTHITHTFT